MSWPLLSLTVGDNIVRLTNLARTKSGIQYLASLVVKSSIYREEEEEEEEEEVVGWGMCC